MKRTLVSNGNPMEKVVGFSRAVRVGPYVAAPARPRARRPARRWRHGAPVPGRHEIIAAR